MYFVGPGDLPTGADRRLGFTIGDLHFTGAEVRLLPGKHLIVVVRAGGVDRADGGVEIVLSDCMYRYSRLTFSAQLRPLNAFPRLSMHCGSPSRHSANVCPKFSAGTTCSHSTFLARLVCEDAMKPSGRVMFFFSSNVAPQWSVIQWS